MGCGVWAAVVLLGCCLLASPLCATPVIAATEGNGDGASPLPLPPLPSLGASSPALVPSQPKPQQNNADVAWAPAMELPQNKKAVLIAVVLAPKHNSVRLAIRNTWANLTADQAERVDVRFFVGELGGDVSEREEIDRTLNADPLIVRLAGFTESYHNLTAKAKGIFKWAYENGYKTILKVDDDSFVRVDNVLQFIDQRKDILSDLYAGHINRQEYGECTVHKNPESKWYMYDQYPHEQFPDFADGPGFILGERGLRFLWENYDTLADYRCDDAAVGIWTDGLSLAKTEMKCSIYEFGCSVDDVFINPVSAGEMYTLHAFPGVCESGYSLDVCLDRPCLCKGHPDRPQCWSEIINQPYQDIIPRLLQLS